MNETTIQARLIAALTPLVAEGSVLVNDHKTPEDASRDRSPWLVIETGDGLRLSTPNFANVEATYEPYVALIVYPRGEDEDGQVNEFQALRQAAAVALLACDGVDLVETVGGLSRYSGDDAGLFQRLRVRVTVYEV
jgi:hypothetical protein